MTSSKIPILFSSTNIPHHEPSAGQKKSKHKPLSARHLSLKGYHKPMMTIDSGRYLLYPSPGDL